MEDRTTEPRRVGTLLLCAEPGCDRPHATRGYCDMHYQRLRRRGYMPPVPKPTDDERFWSKVDKSGDCWLWTGTMNRQTGYGKFSVGMERGRFHNIGAHVFAYESMVGAIPEGLFIDHRCRTKTCVNPDHLRPVTQKQNAENLGDERSNNTSGVRGVYFVKSRNRWRATVQRRIAIGEFESLADAEAAVRSARNVHFTHNDADRTHHIGETA